MPSESWHSPGENPLSAEFFMEGRQKRYDTLPKPYQDTGDAIEDIVGKLIALSTISPITVRIVVANIVADYLTLINDTKLLDLIKATDALVSVFVESDPAIVMSNKNKTEKPDNRLALEFSLRQAELAIAKGESRIVSLEEQEATLNNWEEEDAKIRQRFNRFCCKVSALIANDLCRGQLTPQAATLNSSAMNFAWALMSLPLMFRTCPFLIIAIAS